MSLNPAVVPGVPSYMRLLLIVLVLLTAIIQYPLWWGKGGWQRVRELEEKRAAQQETNEALAARNNALAAEVQDLTAGTDAIEERARGEMGLVQKDEIFVHLVPPSQRHPGQSPRVGQQSGHVSGSHAQPGHASSRQQPGQGTIQQHPGQSSSSSAKPASSAASGGRSVSPGPGASGR